MGECFFWYWPTRVVPDKGPKQLCVCMRACVRACVCVCLAELMHLILLADRGNSSAYYVACVHLCVTFVYTVLWMNAILGCNVM